MKQKIFSTILIVLLGLSANIQAGAQEKKSYQVGLIAFYNLENIFDTVDDPVKIDEQFLPDGSYGWNTLKYMSKLKNMSEAIANIGGKVGGQDIRCPWVVGVSEVENIDVLNDLIVQPALKKYDFGAVLVEGPDFRGIDVGLIYQKSKFRVLNTQSVPTIDPDYPGWKTRDQLVVQGIFMDDTVYIIVMHWPSRSGGEKKSEPKRVIAASTCRSIVDAIFAENPNANIIAMGDLNDDPTNRSVYEVLNAPKVDDAAELQPNQLFNPFYKIFAKEGVGTLAYRGNWNLFDQIIVSKNLTGKDRSHVKMLGARVFNDEGLKAQEGQYKGYPLRTTASGVWLNGFSDHFPTYLIMVKEK
ncbi:MAG: endonuclease/exonuclease/phosphatase family protein [Bacteroidales bacterium]|jgi:hypothetical protein|nr:endonuclease/exonuclease/phosphatase family protein [Bacteroidales bacterium]